MKVLLVVAVLGVASAILLPVASARDFIVVLHDNVGPAAVKDGGSPAAVRRAVRATARRHRAAPSFVYAHALRGYAATLNEAALARAHADPDVAFVAEDREFSLPEPVGNGTQSPAGGTSLDALAAATGGDQCACFHLASQITPFGVGRVGAKLSPTAKIDKIDERVDADIAILDGGIEATHPDLNVVGGADCTSKKAPAGTFVDGNGHGTHVAGTAAAIDNEIGVVGVAPGARLWGVKVLDDKGHGKLSWIVCGIEWVTARSDVIDVANMSLSARGSDDGDCGRTDGDALHLAICNSVAAGVTYAVAAGNDTTDAASRVPATYEEVITVSAIADFNGQPGGGAFIPGCLEETDDTFAFFSDFGFDVDIAAAGVCIGSTYIWPRKCPTREPGTECYATFDGTSMATPHVAGAAALYKANNPAASPAQVKAALIAAWEPGPIPEDPDTFPEGVVNVSTF